jgi:hypothetical protein
MRRIFFSAFFLSAFLSTTLNSAACDLCGSAQGGANFGILPQFYKNFIGLNFYHRDFSSNHSRLGSASVSAERFKTIELRGRIHLNKKVQLFFLAPVNFNQQTESGQTINFSGPGDLTIFANYNIYNNGDSVQKRWKHNFQIGGGLKFPTGKFNSLDERKILNPNLQPGSGTTDLIFDAIYTVRFKNFGINSNAFYFLKTTNSNNFKFGNRLNFSGSLFYWHKVNSISLLPGIGLVFENSRKDTHNSFIITESGGTTLLTNFGLDFYCKNIAVNANFQVPFFQNNPIIQTKIRTGASVIYNF